MGNGVSLMTVGNRLALANGGMKFSKRMLIEQIGLHKEFQKLFVMEEDLFERITESIKAMVLIIHSRFISGRLKTAIYI